MSKAHGHRKEVKKLIEAAEDQGWVVNITNNGHLRFRGPEGQLVFAPSTPSEYRGLKNKRAELRRAGLNV